MALGKEYAGLFTLQADGYRMDVLAGMQGGVPGEAPDAVPAARG
ncbi:hypothetical protein ACIQM0_33555 [Streptomyces sp. NPDC091387]